MANITLGDFYNAIREGAREATLEALAEVDFSTSSKQDTIKGVLDLLATEATLDDVKTALTGLAGAAATETTLAALLAKLDDPATETTLASLASAVATEATLDDVKTAAETLAGTVADGAVKTTLTGSTVEIGGVIFDIDPPRTLYGLADDKPGADDAHATIPFCYYVSVDTQTVEQTDGTQWVEV